jgi:hypothetical protein
VLNPDLAQRSPTAQPAPIFTGSAPAPAARADLPVSQMKYLDAVRFPFLQYNWAQRLWLPSLIAFIPIINFIIMRGWRLEITRRVGRDMNDRLPDPSNLLRFFIDGLVLWFMTGLYLVPEIIMLLIFGFGPLFTFFGWIYNTITGNPHAGSFLALIAEMGIGSFVRMLLPIVYWILTYPLYRVAMVRYAYTGSIGVFFDVGTNLNIARKHMGQAMALYAVEQLSSILFVILSGLISLTGIGAIIVLVLLFPALYWTTGYLFGSFAAQIQAPLLR